MTTYYVGKGGDNGNDGLSWDERWLTLNYAETTIAGGLHTVYVGPGTYREKFTVSYNGSGGTHFNFIGDPTGAITDGIGGSVRITGSDDDITATRTHCIYFSAYPSWRSFYNFDFDLATTALVGFSSSANDVGFYNCSFGETVSVTTYGFDYSLFSSGEWIQVEDSVFIGHDAQMILGAATGTGGFAAGAFANNNIFIGSFGHAVLVRNKSTFYQRNNLYIGHPIAYQFYEASTENPNNCDIYNCIFLNNTVAMQNHSLGVHIEEDYNAVPGNNITKRILISVAGSNSTNDHPLLEAPRLFAGIQLPWDMFSLGEWSLIARKGTNAAPASDIYQITRPASGKESWGPIQYQPAEKDTTEVRLSSDASLRLADAGMVQFFLEVSAVSTTIDVYVKRESNYAGTNPQMIIKEPGQSVRTTTDAGSSGSWNKLTDTFTPSGNIGYVIVELVSNNTATSGDYKVWFEDLAVDLTGI